MPDKPQPMFNLVAHLKKECQELRDKLIAAGLSASYVDSKLGDLIDAPDLLFDESSYDMIAERTDREDKRTTE